MDAIMLGVDGTGANVGLAERKLGAMTSIRDQGYILNNEGRMGAMKLLQRRRSARKKRWPCPCSSSAASLLR